ncbi:hypothetical protein SGGBAA2069_c18770 [Streptococcus gallolyticus subsp. gallolyticus ATCC BAA-2069]|nr:hypothetical protein SGGBAA2069_c18770 [Streptococcus gallolyticus subsp. gallolyticus ATCC BAA-2069]
MTKELTEKADAEAFWQAVSQKSMISLMHPRQDD